MSYFLARPYGRAKLALVFSIILAQGLFQVVGVSSILPFLALAADPQGARQSEFVAYLLRGLPNLSDRALLIGAGVIALVMLLCSNLLILAGEVVRTRYAHGYGHWLRLRLLTRIISNPYQFFLQRNTGELLKKTTIDVMGYINGILAPLLEGVARFVTVVFLLVLLVILDPRLAILATISFFSLYALIFYILRKRRTATSNAMKAANRGAMKEAQQLLGGIKTVKVHGCESSFIKRYANHSAVQASLYKWIPIYQNSPRYLIEPLAFGGIVVVVVYLAAKGEDFASLLPSLGVMALAGYRLIPNIQILYGAATGMSLMLHNLEEVYEEFLDAESRTPLEEKGGCEEKVTSFEWRKSIDLENISFKYEGAAHPTLLNLSASIHKNGFVAIIGETGSGKSTLVDVLLGLHVPQEGRFLVDGNALGLEQLQSWQAGIGYVPQEIFILDDTIAANVAFGFEPAHIDLEQVRKVCKVAQISDFIETELPDSYWTTVGERGVRLSGGQKQRIGLARALYHKPSLLVLDEATSALDNKTEAALMKSMDNLYGKLTLIVIAHRLSTIQKANCVYKLSGGKLVQTENIPLE